MRPHYLTPYEQYAAYLRRQREREAAERYRTPEAHRADRIMARLAMLASALFVVALVFGWLPK